jgi:hypothetical protein
LFLAASAGWLFEFRAGVGRFWLALVDWATASAAKGLFSQKNKYEKYCIDSRFYRPWPMSIEGPGERGIAARGNKLEGNILRARPPYLSDEIQ